MNSIDNVWSIDWGWYYRRTGDSQSRTEGYERGLQSAVVIAIFITVGMYGLTAHGASM